MFAWFWEGLNHGNDLVIILFSYYSASTNLKDEEQHISEVDDQSVGETLLSQMQSPEAIAAYPSSFSSSSSSSSLKSSPETQRSNISIGTLMSAWRWRRLIDSARLPRQPWFPVAAFAERWWLHRVSVAPAALSSSSSTSSSSTVSSNAPYPSPPSRPPSNAI